MVAINWAFLCDYAYADASGKASIIGIFENLNFGNLPAKNTQMFVAIEVAMADGEKFDLTAVITSPFNKEITRMNAKGDAPKGGGKGIVTFGFHNTEFSEIGEHCIELFLGENKVHFIPFTVQTLK